jgi:hypothetical protein
VTKQVDAKSRVTKMSLCATGTPVSGGVAAGDTRIGAPCLRQGDSRADVQKRASVPGAVDAVEVEPREFHRGDLFGHSARPSSATDFSNIGVPIRRRGHEEQTVLLAGAFFMWDSRPADRGPRLRAALAAAEGMRHGFDAVGIDRLQLLDELKSHSVARALCPVSVLGNLDARRWAMRLTSLAVSDMSGYLLIRSRWI